MYSSNHNYQTPIVVNDRSTEALADTNQRLGGVNDQITALEIKLQAMYRVMVEQGVDPALFEAKIDELMEERGTKVPAPQNEVKACPKCGKPVKKNGNTPLLGRCLYCGTVVKFNPTFLSEEPVETEPEPEDPFGPKEF
jgi:hypothetical protein